MSCLSFYYWVSSVPYILRTQVSYQIYDLQIVPSILWVQFSLSGWHLLKQKSLIFIKSFMSIIYVLAPAFVDILTNSLQNPRSSRFTDYPYCPVVLFLIVCFAWIKILKGSLYLQLINISLRSIFYWLILRL